MIQDNKTAGHCSDAVALEIVVWSTPVARRTCEETNRQRRYRWSAMISPIRYFECLGQSRPVYVGEDREDLIDCLFRLRIALTMNEGRGKRLALKILEG